MLQQGGFLTGVWDQAHSEIRVGNFCHCQADAVNGNGAFFHHIPEQFRCGTDRHQHCVALRLHGTNCSRAVNVSGNNVPAESAVRRHGTFQIHFRASFQLSQIAPPQGFRHHICCEVVFVHANHRQANAVHGNAVADLRPLQHLCGGQFQFAPVGGLVQPPHSPHFFYDSGKHLRIAPFWYIPEADPVPDG